ncbi:transcription initiation factor TFIID subunit A domain-containing protein [Ditylenchus destructor]|nr:transcription initiation factor TFIID subunit A domain-containing protein [Ditylenchus destructor]
MMMHHQQTNAANASQQMQQMVHSSPSNMQHPNVQQQRQSGMQYNVMHQPQQPASRQIGHSPQQMQQQQTHLTPPSPAMRRQEMGTPPNIHHVIPQQLRQQQQPTQIVRQQTPSGQYVQFARPNVSYAPAQVHQNQAPSQMRQPPQTIVTVHQQAPPQQQQHTVPIRHAAPQPQLYRQVGGTPTMRPPQGQQIRYAYVQAADGSMQTVQHVQSVQYQQVQQGSALRQALTQETRPMMAQHRPNLQTSMASSTQANYVILSTPNSQPGLGPAVVVSGSPMNTILVDSSRAQTPTQVLSYGQPAAMINVQSSQESSAAMSPPEPSTTPQLLSKPSTSASSARNRPKSKSPNKGLTSTGSSLSLSRPIVGGKNGVMKPGIGSKVATKSTLSNGSLSQPSSQTATNGLIYSSGANKKAILDKASLDELVKSVDPYETLEDDVSDAVLLVLDDFVNELIKGSVDLCKYRGSKRLEGKDVRFLLKRRFDMSVPADPKMPFNSQNGDAAETSNSNSNNSIGPSPKRPALALHQQRLAIIDKSLKKL